MIEIGYATERDCTLWLELDRHIAREELLNKIQLRRCYMLRDGTGTIGIMRYNLFWDSIPFLTMIYLAVRHRNRGFGRGAVSHWEDEMRSLGHNCVMTSTRSDEEAQHFYRKLGYKDAGCLLLDIPPEYQPLEILFTKEI